MNDINELYRPLWFIETDINTCNLQKKAKREIGLFQQISFVQDKGKRKGFDIPAMWELTWTRPATLHQAIFSRF